jgi:hypothetical protein
MATQGFLQPENDAESARDAANAWVAEFAPLVMDESVLTPGRLRERIALIDRLREQGPAVRDKLVGCEDADTTLLTTIENALGQLPSIEDDLRRQLGRTAPGDPAGQPDLDALNARLAERLARQEVGLPTGLDIPEQLDILTAAPNWAGAAFAGLFGFGWTSFTTVHAIFMIGGMLKAFGWAALALLGFYSIFFFVGFAILAAAVGTASEESIQLDGNQLTVRWKLFGWVRKRQYTLAPGVRASVGPADGMSWRSTRNNRPTVAVILTDVKGKVIALAGNSNDPQRKLLRDRINAYLQART